ncbi:MAG: MFS transporter [Gemmatimonadaceae bacterium]|nr:MFS transporter [Gemmatimonadaceae bacterium]
MARADRGARGPSLDRAGVRVQRVQSRANGHRTRRGGAPAPWKLSTITWTFSLAIVALGLSAALFGRWVERVGPRAAMAVAALCFGSGFFVAAIGVRLHLFPLLLLGYGVLGGIGLGIGYISPVSTLLRWFPDRPGMATGMAIMGFGGGGLLGAPIGVWLLTETGSVARTFGCMGVGYGTLMLLGASAVRVPAVNTATASSQDGVTTPDAIRRADFWALWVVLCCNVTAGIGVLGAAYSMIIELFPGRVSPVQAASFVSGLSLSNMLGRIVWSSFSDRIGRFATYAIFFGLGACLYATVPSVGARGNIPLFLAMYALILSMYGGGFATIPAYLRDRFGTREVGAIHGRLLTAWSVAGLIGPLAVSYLRESQLARGVAPADAYSLVIRLMAVVLLIGGTANLVVRRLPRAT